MGAWRRGGRLFSTIVQRSGLQAIKLMDQPGEQLRGAHVRPRVALDEHLVELGHHHHVAGVCHHVVVLPVPVDRPGWLAVGVLSPTDNACHAAHKLKMEKRRGECS